MWFGGLDTFECRTASVLVDVRDEAFPLSCVWDNGTVDESRLSLLAYEQLVLSILN